MGVTLRSKNHEADMSYGSLNILRTRLAGMLLGDEWHAHYASIRECHTDEDYAAHDEKANALCKGLSSTQLYVVDFMYQSDCEGKLDALHCRGIWLLMQLNRSKWVDDTKTFAYVMRPPFTLSDFCEMLADGYDTEEGISWM